jgi:hypothetical protein
MGGLLMRETLYQMQENAGQSPFPPTIGHVEKAITFNTPHNGTATVIADLSCGGCKQGDEMAAGNMLIMELAKDLPSGPRLAVNVILLCSQHRVLSIWMPATLLFILELIS